MRGNPESPSQTYRTARRAFIAACEKAHIDAVSRLHPSKGGDGKPLFMDCAALGPRHAPRAVLAVAHDKSGTDLLIALLAKIDLPDKARLVLVHALDPAAFAGATLDAAWPAAMLGAVATEDLSWVRDLGVLSLDGRDDRLEPALQAKLPKARITMLKPPATADKAGAAIAAFFAAFPKNAP
jgi:hypothetical protein